jgi:phosphatidylglycerol:prolipoprotein diacylglycerol transferase
MTFPVEFHIPLFGRTATIPAHGVFEVLAYCVGFQTFVLLRRRAARRLGEEAALPAEVVVWVIVGAVFGALFGSKMLAWLESAREYWAHRDNPAAWLGGKTIVGGLLGGWIGVELVKRHLHITRRTGDAFVVPLCIGIAIGRIGCFLTGLPDHTYGTATSLPWGVDFGDGIARHPTQLYESIFAVLLGATLLLFVLRHPHAEGDGFRWFMIGYLGFRLLVEFIKPSDKPLLGLSAIQMACALGIAAAGWTLSARRQISAPSIAVAAERTSG